VDTASKAAQSMDRLNGPGQTGRLTGYGAQDSVQRCETFPDGCRGRYMKTDLAYTATATGMLVAMVGFGEAAARLPLPFATEDESVKLWIVAAVVVRPLDRTLAHGWRDHPGAGKRALGGLAAL